jgi:23S rRNA (uracil1939-C5)-methyltransferase
LKDCSITEPAVLAAWQDLREQHHLLPAETPLRVAVRMLGDGFSLVVEGGVVWEEHKRLFEAMPGMAEMWWQPVGKKRRQLHSRTSAAVAGASFTQVNEAVASRLLAKVVSLATAMEPRSAVDAYSGAGDVAVALASGGVRVTAIEIDPVASRVCGSRLPQGSRAMAASVEAALQSALPADVVVLNPPRAGVHARVTDILRNLAVKPKSLIYVSCDPATLARDVRRLDGFNVRSVRGFDMFPQTAHVETVCELVPVL